MANAIRTSYQQTAATLALQYVTLLGDTVTFRTGGGLEYDIKALALPGKATETFGPDTDKMVFYIPYQTNFTTNPDSGSQITFGGNKYAVESTQADDGQFPTSFEVTCFRWNSTSPEIDGN